MSKVYVLMEHMDYEGSSILSVHSSEESAKKELAKIVEEDKERPPTFSYNYTLSANGMCAGSEWASMSLTVGEWEVEE